MDETAKMESHLTSAAAFVEGGIQEACDDACSICLEAFCESDPSTVTSCKHEFHLQCILEWCQRSSQCPMCWQPLSFKDPTSQELLEAVEKERTIRFLKTRNTAIFHHPTLGDFEFQHLPVGANDAELEERIFQHLAAAAAMGRAHLARREGRRGRSGAHGRPQYLVFSSDVNAIPAGATAAASSAQGGLENESFLASASSNSSAPFLAEEDNLPLQASHPISIRSSQLLIPTSVSDNDSIHNQGISNNRTSSIHFTQASEERAGPSDVSSFSESLKSRLSAVSTKYKESITKTTRGWRERFFSRNTHPVDSASENRAEVAPGVTTTSRMVENLDRREASRSEDPPGPVILEGHSAGSNESYEDTQRNTRMSASCAATTDSASAS